MKRSHVFALAVFCSALATTAMARECARPPAVSAGLRRQLDRFKMTYGESSRTTDGQTVVVRWAMYKPRASSQKLPVLVFFPGLGELGPDPERLFGCSGIFDVVTSGDFQKRHPCVFLALQTEAGVDRQCLVSECAEPSLAAMNEAIDDALSRLGSLRVDRGRIYLTGLSAGGGACCSMICAYPGRFAAALPVAGLILPDLLSKSKPENIWMIYNKGELDNVRRFVDMDAISRDMAARGGEFRVGELTGEGHNAWDAAWREQSAWDWMFSKRASGGQAPAAAQPSGRAIDKSKWKCTASVGAESVSTHPKYGADGLGATVFRSAAPANKGDWWQVEFDFPRRGAMGVVTGDDRGRCKVLRGSILVSTDGTRWRKVVAVRDGKASFRVDQAVRFVRLQIDVGQREPFAVRELDMR